MESEERSSTGSTVSGVFKTILQSPTPICMFYFSHPFGVSSPSQVKESRGHEKGDINSSYTLQYTNRKSFLPRDKSLERNEIYYDSSRLKSRKVRYQQQQQKQKQHTHHHHHYQHHHNHNHHKDKDHHTFESNSIRLIPWPRDTWKRDFVLPPLIQFRGKRDDGLAPDLESVLRTIRQAWNSPIGLSTCAHSHKQETFWKQFCNQDYVTKMGSGTNRSPTSCMRLLKRRYSVPEIIMRKHELAQQRPYDDYTTASFPSPKHLPSTGISSSNSTSSIYRKSGPLSSNSLGSDGNLTRRPTENLRKSSLLRQMWEKEARLKYHSVVGGSSSGNIKIPHLRNQSQHKGFSVDSAIGDIHSNCEECRRLHISRDMDDDDNNDVEPIASKLLLNGRKLKQHQLKQQQYIQKTPSTDDIPASTTDTSQSNSVVSTQESLSNSKHDQFDASKDETSETLIKDQLEISLPKTPEIQQNDERTDNNEDTKLKKQEQEKDTGAEGSESGDSTLDAYISQMLIDNLRELALEAKERCKNKIKYEEIKCFNIKDTSQEGKVTEQCDKDQSEMDSSVLPSVSRNHDSPEKAASAVTLPSATPEDSLPEYGSSSRNDSSSQLQLDRTFPCPDIIQINAGSVYSRYSDDESILIIPRFLKIVPRTESIEVQPSSASIVEEEETFCQNSDESLSLVDSLDELVAEDNDESLESSLVPALEKDEGFPSVEKSQAFFVPITSSGGQQDIAKSAGLTVAETMPKKLKERIAQRQLELDAKKECHRKSYHYQSDEFLTTKAENKEFLGTKPKRKKHLVLLGKKENNGGGSSKEKSRKRLLKNSREMMRSEIGLLESYTIDSRGNLQFCPSQKTSSKSHQSSKSNVVEKQSIVTTRPPPKPTRSSHTSSSSQHSRKCRSSPKDIQKMTIFQTQSDIITPDDENGPRRIYQKTEIQDGEKRIEILEIVECLESSEDSSSPTRQIRSKLIKSSSGKRSRIPIPIAGRIGRSARIRDSSGRCSPREHYQSNLSPKVDRAIAELLIGAINRSDQTVIEVIRSPKEIPSPGVTRSSRGQLVSRRNTPKRSANSGRYRQIFEVIPEEKSSLSMDSSNEETTKDNRKSKQSHDVSATTTTDVNASDTAATGCSNTTKPLITNTPTTTNGNSSSLPSPIMKTPIRAKDAFETSEPKAWIDFFKRHDSSIDEDDDIISPPYPSTTIETSCPQTITTPSTVTAVQGTMTPKNSSSTTPYLGSSESDNVFKKDRNGKIAVAMNDLKTSQIEILPPVLQPKKESSSSKGSKKQSESLIQGLKELPVQGLHPVSSNVNVWRVQSPDICLRTIPKSKLFADVGYDGGPDKCPPPEDTESTEIDSRSFIICSDGSTLPSSTNQLETSTTSFSDCHGNFICGQQDLLTKCTSCCFCNPTLHITELVSSDSCVYCNRKKTPQKKEEETNTESDYFQKHDFYRTTSIRDHTHTRSRDSDSVSTKCTRTNEKIKRYAPTESSRASNSEICDKTAATVKAKNINRPRNVNNLPKNDKKSISKIVQDEIKVTSPQKKKTELLNSKFGPLPSPYKTFSSYSYNRSSTPTSSSDSTCPTTPEKRMIFPKVKCRNYKSKTRKSKGVQPPSPSPAEKKMNKSDDNGERAKDASAAAAGAANTGWTVTLAGSCSQGPPPDVEMRLSFPKEQSSPNRNVSVDKTETAINASAQNANQDNYTYDDNRNPIRNSVLPPATTADSRRALPNNMTGGNVQKNLIFPEVDTNSPRNQLVPRGQMTKKAFKHLECNVALTSATRTVSNFTRGRRSMSYQSSVQHQQQQHQGDPAQKFSSRERQIRDSSLDLGFLSSRRLSFECPTPPPLESLALSIMGNAIAPERKPRVLTMSEKDLTRRHSRCFTRNRAFFT